MSDLRELLSRIDDLASQVAAVRPLDYTTEQKIRQKLWLDWNYHSNAIEGNTLSMGETRAFLLHGITAQGKPFRDYLDIDGHRKAIDYLEEFVRQDEELTEAYIRELHRVMLVEPYEADAMTPDGRLSKRIIQVGQYKSVPNSVRTSAGAMHFYASPEETPARMGDLMAWYREVTSKGEIHPVVLAATFHFKFVEIHPFDDGNGRMSRLLMNLMLMRNELVPIIIPTERKPEYILALEQADTGELESFIGFIGEQVIESLELYLKAAGGEPIENLFDLDKRLQLLDKRLTGEGGVAEIEKSTQAQHETYEGFIRPFFMKVHQLMLKMERFFGGSDIEIICHPAKTFLSFPYNTFNMVLTKVETITYTHLLDYLELKYQLDNLEAKPHIDAALEIKIFFNRYHFAIETKATAKLKRTSTEYQYNQIPDEDEIDQLIYKISAPMIDRIERHLKVL